MADKVSYKPSQSGNNPRSVPLGWTANPFQLCWSDLKLFFRNINNLLGILFPLPQHHLDELFPTWMNLWTLAVHIFLVIYQLLFILSLGLAFIFIVPYPIVVIYSAAVIIVNKLLCHYLLNGPKYLDSNVDLTMSPAHPTERWIFLNGVSVGSHWLQANVDRLALTFRRNIRGVHNPTDGIVFDLINCLIERNFSYSTDDVREAYVQIKRALLDPQYKKIVLILHSEGGIQGSLIVDWLLDEAPQSLLDQLEIYTFGNAANHFNNPCKTVDTYYAAMRGEPTSAEKTIRYIEHYGNSGDFVARWGLLAFTKIPVRFMGRIFERPGSGHLLNQHYLNAMFPLDENGRCKETSKFMEMAVDPGDHNADDDDIPSPETPAAENNMTASGQPKAQSGGHRVNGQDQRMLGKDHREGLMDTLIKYVLPDSMTGDTYVKDVNSPVERIIQRQSKTLRVKDFSRLWQYRNGMSPPDTT